MNKDKIFIILFSVGVATYATYIVKLIIHTHTVEYFTEQLRHQVWKGDVAAAKKWIDKGADVNAPGSLKTGQSLLSVAMNTGNTEMVALLLSHGAS